MDLPAQLHHADGEIRIVGHRIGLFHVIDLYQDGYSPEMIAEEYPTLSLALIHHVIAFYLDNRNEVDAYVVSYRELLNRQEANTPTHPAAIQIRERLRTRQRIEAPVASPGT